MTHWVPTSPLPADRRWVPNYVARLIAVGIATVIMSVGLQALAPRAEADIPPRGWVDLECTFLGSEHTLTTYTLDTPGTTPLKCGTAAAGWTHIVDRHGENGTATRWSTYNQILARSGISWHYLMDAATQMTLYEHNKIIIRNRVGDDPTQPIHARCFINTFEAWVDGAITTRDVKVVLAGYRDFVITSYIDESQSGCRSGIVEWPGAQERSAIVPTKINCGGQAGGCYAHLSRGASVYISDNTAARLIKGAIRNRWQAMDWERSFLKYPRTSERCGLIRGGCFNHFEGGSIYYTSTTGAWPIGGAFRTAWAESDWERSPLGYPASMEEHPGNGAPANHRIQNFEYGFMYWDGSTVTGEWTDPGCPTCRTRKTLLPR